MPKLDLQSCRQFWHGFNDPMIYRVIAYLEHTESWTYDGNPELEKALEALGDALENVQNFELSKEEWFINLCAHLKSSRILRILQAIDSVEPGSASRVLMYAEERNDAEHPLAALFLKRNIAFERLRLLGRVFSQERFELIDQLFGEEY